MTDPDTPQQNMTSPFRLSPPEPNRPLVLRPRLLNVLGGRFDRRLTVLVGGAGFGKTSLLGQAIEQNRLDPQGHDVWVGCASGDGAAQALAAVVIAALGATVEQEREPVESIVAAVWARAPEPVCLVLDDVHQVDEGSSGAELLDRLLVELPDNGHVLMSGRVHPSVRSAKLRAQGELAVVDEAALSFTDAEAASFAELRNVDKGDVAAAGGWPALSELHIDAPMSATGEFLWEEVLDGLKPETRDTVIRLGPFEVVDDELLHVLTDSTLTVSELAQIMPLAKVVDETVRIHDLWRSVLLDAVDGSNLEPGWHRPAVDLLRKRGRYREAFDALIALDDHQWTANLVQELSRVDFPELRSDDLLYVLKQLPPALAETGDAIVLRGSMLLGIDTGSALDAYEAAVAWFRGDDDPDGEALAQIRRCNVMFMQGDVDGMTAVAAEIAVLADRGVTLAVRSLEMLGAFLQLMAGNLLEAIATVEKGGLRNDPELSLLGSYLVAHASIEYGHVERALAEAETCIDRASGHLRIGLQGLIVEARLILEPDDAQSGEEGLLSLMDQARVLDLPGSVAVAVGGYASWLAIQGRAEEARERLREAQVELAGVTTPRFLLTVRMAEMTIALLDGREDDARSVGLDTIDEAPFGVRPDRNYLVFFDAVYVLLPEIREQLDELPLGPDYDNFRTLAQAVVRLREENDLKGVADLPWERPDFMRGSILEPFLVELVVAASIEGVRDARALLGGLHLDPHTLLRRVADRYDGPMAAEAKRILRRTPARPADPLRICALGPVELHRAGHRVDESGWDRERVRSLLLYLVDAGRIRRDRAATALWGDMDEEAAINNLRVTLNHLQQVLQPQRDRDSTPFFLRTDGDYIGLVEDPLLTIDVHEFERRIEQAARAEADRAPSLALEHHLAAVDLYRGPYLIDGADWDWGYFDRVRFQSLFVESAVRAGELVLARGDAREADRLAVRAAEEEPYSEPAHRLRARALAAASDRAAARSVMNELIESLCRDGLEPEAETLELLDHL